MNGIKSYSNLNLGDDIISRHMVLKVLNNFRSSVRDYKYKNEIEEVVFESVVDYIDKIELAIKLIPGGVPFENQPLIKFNDGATCKSCKHYEYLENEHWVDRCNHSGKSMECDPYEAETCNNYEVIDDED